MWDQGAKKLLARTIGCYSKEFKKTIGFLCGLFGMSRQWFYRSAWRVEAQRATSEEVVRMVHKVRQDLPKVGTRKLHHLLQAPLTELGVGRDKLFSILRANNMLIVAHRNYHTTTNSKHMFRKHKNLIEGMVPTKPEQVWVSDITYIGSQHNHQYLSLVTDAYSKKIVGYDLSDSLDASGSVKALKMAIKNRFYKDRQLIHHSDRGVQYCCCAYQKQMSRHGIQCSMTESYDPYANAVAERINGILKQEFLFAHKKESLPAMQTIIKESIDRYNSVRPHLSCKMLTPNQMHCQQKVKIKTYRKKLVSKGTLGD